VKGLFITLEGPDGSGKSTIVKLLSEYFNEKGFEVVLTREPGGTQIGEKIRDIVLDNKNIEMSSTTEALLYAASRAQHIQEKILPSLEDGKIIICERFVHSSLVYQGIGRALGVNKIKEINNFAIQGVEPDVTLFFDIDPERALKRKTKKGEGDRLEMEDVSFHRDVYEGYLKICKMYPEEIKVIDAGKNIKEVFNQVRNIIDSLLKI